MLMFEFTHTLHDDDQDFLESLAEDRENRDLEEQEFMAAFSAAVDDLPERYRTVFTLCVREGRPYQEAADKLGLPTGTVAIAGGIENPLQVAMNVRSSRPNPEGTDNPTGWFGDRPAMNGSSTAYTLPNPATLR